MQKKYNKKSTYGLILVSIFLLGTIALSGCIGQEETVFTVVGPWSGAEYEAFKPVLDAFTDKTGIEYNYTSIKDIFEYQQKVPLQTYDDVKPFVERLRSGEKDLLWPGEIKWFAKSSGTTSDKSKFIPVSREALEDCHYRGGKDIIAFYTMNFPDTKMLKGKGLTLGGSQKLSSDQNQSYYGDLSAILIHNLPFWAEFIKTPNKEIALMDKWEEKLEKITIETINENVTSIAGVPSWMLVLIVCSISFRVPGFPRCSESRAANAWALSASRSTFSWPIWTTWRVSAEPGRGSCGTTSTVSSTPAAAGASKRIDPGLRSFETPCTAGGKPRSTMRGAVQGEHGDQEDDSSLEEACGRLEGGWQEACGRLEGGWQEACGQETCGQETCSQEEACGQEACGQEARGQEACGQEAGGQEADAPQAGRQEDVLSAARAVVAIPQRVRIGPGPPRPFFLSAALLLPVPFPPPPLSPNPLLLPVLPHVGG